MKSISNYFYAIFLIMLCSCKATKYSDNQIKTLANLVENKNYTIESDWAYPQVTNAMQQVLNSGILQPGNSPNAINLIGNGNFLTISGDSITTYLPYFGERQMNVDYGGRDSAIQLEGIMKNYTITEGKHNSFIIKFDANSKNESFKTQIRLFPNLKADIQMLGNSRFQISYSGTVEKLNEQ